MRHIGRKVVALRHSRGMSQDELARRSGVTQAAISHIENDEYREVRPITLRKLAKALRVTVEYLSGPTPVVKAGDRGLKEVVRAYEGARKEERQRLVAYARKLTRGRR